MFGVSGWYVPHGPSVCHPKRASSVRLASSPSAPPGRGGSPGGYACCTTHSASPPPLRLFNSMRILFRMKGSDFPAPDGVHDLLENRPRGSTTRLFAEAMRMGISRLSKDEAVLQKRLLCFRLQSSASCSATRGGSLRYLLTPQRIACRPTPHKTWTDSLCARAPLFPPVLCRGQPIDYLQPM